MGIWTRVKETGKTGYRAISSDVKKATTSKAPSRKYKIVKKPKLIGYKSIPKKVKGKWVVEKVPQVEYVKTKVYSKSEKKVDKSVKSFLMKKNVTRKKRPSVRRAIKRHKRKSVPQIKESLGYGRQLNLGGLYK